MSSSFTRCIAPRTLKMHPTIAMLYPLLIFKLGVGVSGVSTMASDSTISAYLLSATLPKII
ncbi:hypothetical protein D3C73_1322670 [compost metagenome]